MPQTDFGTALGIIDDVWKEASASPMLARELGLPVDGLPIISEANAIRRSNLAQDILHRISMVDTSSLPGDLALTLGVARLRAESWSREAEWYWLVTDPCDCGFFGMFAPTAYCGGFLLGFVADVFRDFAFAGRGDVDRYLGLAWDYARLVHQMRERTEGQAERGIVMPRLQLEQSIALVTRLREAAQNIIAVASHRLAAVDPHDFPERLQAVIDNGILPAFDQLLQTLDADSYRAAAPDAVGLGRYPGGPAVYADLVRMHTTLDLDPATVHDKGLARMRHVRQQMDAILIEAGFNGTPAQYLEALANEPDWRADGEEAIQALFRRYIDRIAPRIPELFAHRPKAGHDASALPDALSGSMTFGYYSPPTASQPNGLFLFNARNLSRNPLPNIAALNYHELVPGHHFHIASQRENQALHPLRRFSFVNAYNEGWAEYAATLAGEIGMYAAPEEKFGRLMMEAFLTCRLVVDTGMNALGWTLEQARDYLRENGFMPEAEVNSESLRYSADIPAQSLAYKLGDDFMRSLRQAMRDRLGKAFDIRDFHHAVLSPGALPLPLLKTAVEAETDRLLAAA